MAKPKKRSLIDNNLQLGEIEPLTNNQRKAFDSLNNLVLCGSAGTGKTFISLYLAFDDILKDQYGGVTLIRSAVPTRDIGFLPGSEKEKSKIYETPYYNICNELFGRGDAYEILKTKGIVEFMTTSYLRGLTLNDTVIIVDETQNMTFHELDSIITRVGKNCRVLMCGDFYQSDLKTNGLADFVTIIKRMDCFDFIEFDVEDIVRSDFVRDYLIQKHMFIKYR
jgi:phosphate starvation-inducible PhoH-like protein